MLSVGHQAHEGRITPSAVPLPLLASRDRACGWSALNIGCGLGAAHRPSAPATEDVEAHPR
jgi:hypothetical protein